MTLHTKQGLFIGLMSGTSLDGFDATLVSISHQTIKTISSHSTPFSSSLRQDLMDLCIAGKPNELEEAHQASVRYALEAAECINTLLNKSKVKTQEVLAIGCHGQTVRHRPEYTPAYTIQLGDASTLAHQTGITVVNDFRMADIAAGGQGAPLVPAFHKEVFSHCEKTRFIVNIGGISNITVLPAEAEQDQNIYGFDTGPGNTLLDQWVQKNSNKHYDNKGEWARSGTLNSSLLQKLLEEPYFSQTPPKSTGRELFNLDWLNSAIKEQAAITDQPSTPNQISAQDIQRTLAELTALTIVNDINQLAEKYTQEPEIYLCGGGVKNTFLVSRLQELARQIPVYNTADIGLDPQLVEASAFAWLAKQALAGLPGNLQEVTGASQAKILGGIYPC